MKILLVSSFLPFPLYSGGHIRLFNLLKELSQDHEITLVCEKRGYQTENDIAAVRKLCKEVFVFDRVKQWSMQTILKTGFSSDAFLTVGHTLPAMKTKISELLLSNTFDVIHCETSYVFQNIPQTTIPIVLVEHNIEYTIYDKFTKQRNFLLKALLSIDVKKLQRNEESTWKKASLVIAVSENEQSIIAKKARMTALVPNGVDLDLFTPKKVSPSTKRNRKILFIGDFKYIQNQDAALFLIREVYPLIKKQDVSNDITLWIVGRSIPLAIKRSSSDTSILFDEHATQPTAEIFSEADLLLAPLRISGGTQYKILESLAVGTPVVTTKMGKEGLAVQHEKDILVAETPETLAKACLSLLRDSVLSRTLAQNGRTLIEENYSWKRITKELEKAYESVVQ